MIRGGVIGSSRRRSAGSPLLDTYPAAVAYSLRKLRTAYSGSAIRVRRASDNSEQNIGFSGNDLDVSALTTFCSGTDGFIRTWYDQSGNNLDLEQTTAGIQPRIVSGGTVDEKNSKPALYFNNKLLTRAALSFMEHSNNSTHFSLSSHETAGGAGTVFSSSNEARFTVFHDRGTLKTNLYIQNSGGTGYDTLLSVQRDNSDLRLQSSILTSSKNMSAWDNGATGTTNTYTGTYTNSTFRVGRQFLDLNGLKGHIPEIILYDSDQSSNRVAIESNINTYYGIF